MTRTENKKNYRTKAEGTCGKGCKGLTWTEYVKTTKDANRFDRHNSKALIKKVF